MKKKFFPAGTLLFSNPEDDLPEEESMVLVLSYHPNTGRDKYNADDWYKLLVGEDKKEWMADYVHRYYETAKDEE